MHKIEYLAVKCLVFVFDLLSFKAGKIVADIIYIFVAKIIRYRRDVILDNLYKVYKKDLPDEKRWLLNNIYKNFVYLWMEFLQANQLDANILDTIFHVQNQNVLDEALAEGKGVVLVTGHLGSFEWLGQWLSLKGYMLSVIAKRQSNPYVNEFIEHNRCRFGLELIYQDAARKDTLKALKKNRLVGFISDQYAGDRGVIVNFMGVPSSTAAGAAVFHLKTGAPIVHTVSIRRDYGKFDIYFEKVSTDNLDDPSDDNIKVITQRHASMLEKWVYKYPEQWFWMHRRWKTQPGQ